MLLAHPNCLEVNIYIHFCVANLFVIVFTLDHVINVELGQLWLMRRGDRGQRLGHDLINGALDMLVRFFMEPLVHHVQLFGFSNNQTNCKKTDLSHSFVRLLRN